MYKRQLWGQRWFTAFLTSMIILITFFPVLFERRFRIHIPPELQLSAIGFVFGSLFLGEVRDYYSRFWWWDTALHTLSGFLLGILGFLLVHVMNQMERIHIHLKPGFVAFFAFMFALGVGALWEIFEFTMDSVFGMNMQKPMPSVHMICPAGPRSFHCMPIKVATPEMTNKPPK